MFQSHGRCALPCRQNDLLRFSLSIKMRKKLDWIDFVVGARRAGLSICGTTDLLRYSQKYLITEWSQRHKTFKEWELFGKTSLDDIYQRMLRVLQLIGGLHKHNITNHLQPGMVKEHLSPRTEAVHKEKGSSVCCYEELPLKVAVSITYIMDDINKKSKHHIYFFI